MKNIPWLLPKQHLQNIVVSGCYERGRQHNQSGRILYPILQTNDGVQIFASSRQHSKVFCNAMMRVMMRIMPSTRRANQASSFNLATFASFATAHFWGGRFERGGTVFGWWLILLTKRCFYYSSIILVGRWEITSRITDFSRRFESMIFQFFFVQLSSENRLTKSKIAREPS